MEYMSNQEREKNPSPTTSPQTTTTTTNGYGVSPQSHPPTTPRSDPNNHPYPTTFVQADTTNFKQVVQMLTGSTTAESFKQTPSRQSHIPPKRQGFKLYERRNNNSLKNSLMINTLAPNFPGAGFSPRNKPPEILSPSLLDFPSLTLSPVTPLGHHYNNHSSSSSSSEEEERAMAEKGFYFHPKSPMSTPRDSSDPPRLLPLFPLTSPRLSSSDNSSVSLN